MSLGLLCHYVSPLCNERYMPRLCVFQGIGFPRLVETSRVEFYVDPVFGNHVIAICFGTTVFAHDLSSLCYTSCFLNYS